MQIEAPDEQNAAKAKPSKRQARKPTVPKFFADGNLAKYLIQTQVETQNEEEYQGMSVDAVRSKVTEIGMAMDQLAYQKRLYQQRLAFLERECQRQEEEFRYSEGEGRMQSLFEAQKSSFIHSSGGYLAELDQLKEQMERAEQEEKERVARQREEERQLKALQAELQQFRERQRMELGVSDANAMEIEPGVPSEHHFESEAVDIEMTDEIVNEGILEMTYEEQFTQLQGGSEEEEPIEESSRELAEQLQDERAGEPEVELSQGELSGLLTPKRDS